MARGRGKNSTFTVFWVLRCPSVCLTVCMYTCTSVETNVLVYVLWTSEIELT